MAFNLTVAEADAFRTDSSVNPLSNRRITYDGRLFKDLVKACDVVSTKSQDFCANPRINPETGRPITLGGPTYTKLMVQYGIIPEWPEDDETQAQCDLTAARYAIKMRQLGVIDVTSLWIKLRDDIVRACGREFRSSEHIEAFNLTMFIHPENLSRYHNYSPTNERIGELKYEFMELMWEVVAETEVYRNFDDLRKVIMKIPISDKKIEKI